jgi:transmembrane sensor
MSDTSNLLNFAAAGSLEAQAADWVARLDRDDATDLDRAAFDAWKARSPLHQRAAERLQTLWSGLDDLAALADPVASLEARPPVPIRRRRVWPIAAGIAVTIGAGLILLSTTSPQVQTYETAVGAQRTVNLPDGSSVQLNTGTRVEVRYSSQARDLRLLQGEAFFEVAPNKARPFSVYARDGVVRAIGTAFAVRLEGRKLDVTVTKGVVEVSSVSGRAGASRLEAVATLPRRPLATLYANSGTAEAIVVDAQLVRRADVAPQEATRRLAWRQGMLVFTGDDLSEVIADVSRYTDVEIEIADPRLNDLKVGGYFKVGEVEPMLEALETGFGVRVERLDAKHVRLSAGA